ncbi:uncharacterized protein LOC131077750 isoform X2 [Cryptomeria japonica]|uniref:uncharacterized protein LOC131077750 isoform X2 n=1 Tax=Cryptomeria japonica TaxID=3369 RepID=UPI0025ABA174|nr:uncharacterized protein LOC131077750 isoform X2 [Cryptomeria japonica]
MGGLGTPNLLKSHHFHSNELLKLPRRGAQRICSATDLKNSALKVRCCDRPSTTKVGRIGQDRFKEGALPGTYWKAKADSEIGGEVLLTFNKDSKKEILRR